MSSDGINWKRGAGPVEGSRAADDAGACMESDGSDWWTLDTHSLAVSDVQMFSSAAVNSGTGVYWMFYTGCNFDDAAAPEALQRLVGAAADAEGLCGRPGLAMSQVRRLPPQLFVPQAGTGCRRASSWLRVPEPQVVAVVASGARTGWGATCVRLLWAPLGLRALRESRRPTVGARLGQAAAGVATAAARCGGAGPQGAVSCRTAATGRGSRRTTTRMRCSAAGRRGSGTRSTSARRRFSQPGRRTCGCGTIRTTPDSSASAWASQRQRMASSALLPPRPPATCLPMHPSRRRVLRCAHACGVAGAPCATRAVLCRWEKQGPVFEGGPQGGFDEAGAGARCVVRDVDSRRYFMFYEGVAADGRRSIGVAVSEDGRGGWQRHEEPVLRAGEGGAWDAAEVGAPCAVSMAAGRWRLYYSGRGADGVWGGVGVALSEEGHAWNGAPTKFRRREA